MTVNEWEKHYHRDRSVLTYPDEQLVRMLKPSLGYQGSEPPASIASIRAVDLGCGTGRHMRLLNDLGLHDSMGIDVSRQALDQCSKHVPGWYIQAGIDHLPLRGQSINLAIAWGSLHYAHKNTTAGMLAEIYRVLRPGGQLFGTLRSSRDTHTRRGQDLGSNTWRTSSNDIDGAIISFFDEDELRDLFSIFDQFHYGIMERTLLDDRDSMVSHWFYRAGKKI